MPLHWLSSLPSRSTVTLNIEATSARVLVTDGRRVTHWGSVPLPPGLVKDGLIVAPAQVGSLIESLLVDKRLSRKRVIVSVPGMRSVPRILTLPKIKPALLRDAIRYEAEREMPVPLEELNLFWKSLGGDGSERQFFVVGVPKALFDAELQALDHAGMSAPVLDLKPMALARAVDRKEAVIVNLETESSDIVLVVDGVPVIMRTLILRGDEVAPQDKVGQAAAEVSRTVEFYNSGHPDHPISSATPVFVTGELAKDSASADLVRAAISNPVEKLEPVLECPADMNVSEYAVNIGLALKGSGPRRIKRVTALPALDLPMVLDSNRAHRSPMRRWLYALLAVIVVALLVPVYQAKLNGQTEVLRLELELDALRQQLQDVRQVLDPVESMTIEAARLKEEARAVLGASGGFTEGLEVVFGALPAGVELTSITMTGDAINVDGAAATRGSAIEYAALLEDTGLFSSVQIASLTMVSGNGDGSVTTFAIVVRSR